MTESRHKSSTGGAAGPGPARELYVNRNLTGSVAPPLFGALFASFGALFYLPLLVGLCMLISLALTGWLLGWPSSNIHTTGPILTWPLRAQAGLAFACLAGLLGAAMALVIVGKAWMDLFRIVRSRSYLRDGYPLSTVEGYPVFSGGRLTAKSGVLPPDKLTIGDVAFDLDLCRKNRDLLRLREQNLLGVEPSPLGWIDGFRLRTSMRVYYVPTTRLLHSVSLASPPESEAAEIAGLLRNRLMAWRQRNIAELSQSDLAKTTALLQELETLGTQLSCTASAAARRVAETRLAELANWLEALGISIPDGLNKLHQEAAEFRRP